LTPRRSIQKYKLTLFDKYGPDAGNILQAFSHGLLAFGLSIPLFMVAAYKLVDDKVLKAGWWPVLWVVACTLASGCLATLAGLVSSGFAGAAWKHLMVSGASTPYVPQFSMQDAMVKQGRIDEALASFEAIILERPEEIDPRVKAGELYVRQGNHQRALELFRYVQGMPSIDVGNDISVSYKLIDLYDGPLADRGRAIVELRRLIDRHPDSGAAAHAREALATLKQEHIKLD